MRWLDGITDSMDMRRGSQGASRAAPGKSGLHARGEGERVLALESREGTRASRRVEEVLKEISPGCSLEGLMLKLRLQYFGHLMSRAYSSEKTLMLGCSVP